MMICNGMDIILKGLILEIDVNFNTFKVGG
jgi:hypothetical protein